MNILLKVSSQNEFNGPEYLLLDNLTVEDVRKLLSYHQTAQFLEAQDNNFGNLQYMNGLGYWLNSLDGLVDDDRIAEIDDQLYDQDYYVQLDPPEGFASIEAFMNTPAPSGKSIAERVCSQSVFVSSITVRFECCMRHSDDLCFTDSIPIDVLVEWAEACKQETSK